jgi:uncharacterized protein YdhG (YjbR/CyaY superfamily)
MAAARFASVDEYLASQPEAARAALERVRRAIRAALPRAAEGIAYQIPAYKVGGRAAIYFAGWKRHYSLYPVSREIAAALGEALGPYELAKSTLKLPLSRPVPGRLIARIAKLRAKALAAGGASKRARAKAARPAQARKRRAAQG